MSANQSSLCRFFNPRSLAVVGASPQAGAGSIVLRNLARLGYAGKVFPINPKYTEVLGLPCYPSLEAIPHAEPVDAVAVLLGGGRLLPVLEIAADRGVSGAWAFASGFAETGEEGRRLQDEVRAFCLGRDLLFCGPNCVGFANLIDKVAMYSAPLPATFRTGGIGVIAQSGAVLLALGNSTRRAGFSRLISSGNEAVLDLADYMDYLVADPETRVLALFVESIRQPEHFIAACEAAANAGKPVIMLKVGRSDLARRVAATHTGALAGSDRVLDAVIRRCGVIRVHTLDDLLESAVLADTLQLPPCSRRLALCTVSGGEMGMLADLATEQGFVFPPLSAEGRAALGKVIPPYSPLANPLDAWGSGDLREAYPASLGILAAEPEADMVLVSQDMPANMTEEQVVQFTDVAKAAVRVRKDGGKPVCVLSNIGGGLDPSLQTLLEEGGVPVLQGSASGLRALAALSDWATWRSARTSRAEAGPVREVTALPPDLEAELAACTGLAPYPLAARLLAHFGVPLEGERLVPPGSPKDAPQLAGAVRAAAEDLGWPVALKGLVQGVAHKTETGLVALNLRHAEELDAACSRILANMDQHHPGQPREGLLVQRMAPGGAVEMLVGTHRDPAFGPVLMVGLGGIFVELLKDTRLALAPLEAAEADALLADLKGAALLQGFRGREAADRNALIDLILRVGRMAHALRGKLRALDLNPVLVLPQGQGLRVVDVVMELD